MSRRVSFSPEYESHTVLGKHGRRRSGGGGRVAGKLTRIVTRVCGFWRSRGAAGECSPPRFLLRVGAKLARTLRMASWRRRRRRYSRKGSPSFSSSAALMRSRPMSSDQTESHRAEAVEDCIEFLHSSSSFFQRPSSASACS